jgi:hypothetical protein
MRTMRSGEPLTEGTARSSEPRKRTFVVDPASRKSNQFAVLRAQPIPGASRRVQAGRSRSGENSAELEDERG